MAKKPTQPALAEYLPCADAVLELTDRAKLDYTIAVEAGVTNPWFDDGFQEAVEKWS